METYLNINKKIKQNIFENKRSFLIVNFVISVVTGLLIFFLFPVTFSMELKTATVGTTKVYYSSNGYYRESDSISYTTKANSTFEKYKAKIPITKISNIRIDPINLPGDFEIKSLSFSFMNKKETIENKNLISNIEVINDIVEDTDIKTKIFIGHSIGEDPYLEIETSAFTSKLIKSPERYLLSFFCFSIMFLFGLIFRKGLKIGIINLKNVYFANIFILLLILAIPPDGLSYIKTFIGIILLYVIPGYLFLNVLGIIKKQTYIHSKFVLSFVVGFSLFFTLLYITSTLKIPVSSIFVYIIIILCLILFLFSLFKQIKKKTFFNEIQITQTDLVLIILFNILLFVFIIPLKGLLVAPLHDPAELSICAKILIESKYILTNLPHNNLFYPPGGYYLIGLLSDFINISTPKVTMIVTNLFNVFTGFAFSTMMVRIFNKKYFPIISILVFSFVSSFPSVLYFMAGKNSQIIAYVFLFISLFFFYESIGNNIKYKIIFGLVLFTSILVHYNNLLPTLIFCIAIYIYKVSIKKSLSFKFIIKDLFKWVGILIFVLLMFYFQFKIINSVEYSSKNILSSDGMNFSFITLKNFYNWFLSYRGFPGNRNSVLVFYLCVISYFILMIKFIYTLIKYKKVNKEILFVFFILLGYYFARYVQISSFIRYFTFNMYLIYIIPITVVICYLLENEIEIKLFARKIETFLRVKLKYLIIFSFIAVGSLNMFYLFSNFDRIRICTLVREADIKAFEWINENLPSGSRFLPANIGDIAASNQTFVQDSAIYLKAFTHSYELFGFVYGNELPNEFELRQTYLSLIGDPTNQSIMKEFTSSGVSYVFSGVSRPWGCGDIQCDLFDNYPNYYEKIYDIDGVKIYEIKSEDTQ